MDSTSAELITNMTLSVLSTAEKRNQDNCPRIYEVLEFFEIFLKNIREVKSVF